MQSMLEPNSNANRSKQAEHVRTKHCDEFVNMIWGVVEPEQTNSLWFLQMVHRKTHRELPVKQGRFKIQASFQTDVVMTSLCSCVEN